MSSMKEFMQIFAVNQALNGQQENNVTFLDKNPNVSNTSERFSLAMLRCLTGIWSRFKSK